ncbi:rhodanese-like domain-containing protein [Amorphus sp. 3PC139-8]|uniref:rhodanese-like domain-containing protein n=1 Tax=Amorphus sp. 3PC139-8 TaxID=2735676 RepID=UPI00345DD60F
MSELSPQEVKAALSDGKEIAFLDVREHGQYGEGHPFFVVNCPFSRLEAETRRLVPNLSARTVLLDDGDGVAARAAQKLARLGYANLFVLTGGAPAWEAAGYGLFKGVNVPSKAYGEMVESDMGTPSVAAEELDEMIRSGEDLVVLDGRGPDEFAKMNIPTARSCPNAELGLRIGELVQKPDTRIVINCAGRTRSIIGAQTLRSLGLTNPVHALRNGSQGWQLAGLKLQYGSEPLPLPEPGARTLADVAARRSAFLAANDLPLVSRAQLDGWLRETDRTTYLLDVRSAEEFQRGTLRGAQHAPGGQLVQATDQWVGVRGARIVLVDNRDIRAATTAFWLRRMGHDAVILDLDVRELAEPPQAGPDWTKGLSMVSPQHVAGAVKAGAQLIDASKGRAYRQAHIDGAAWAIRPRLSTLGLDTARTVIVAGQDPAARRFVAEDLTEAGFADVRVLDGGPDDWKRAGLPVVATPDVPDDDEMIDFLFFVHDRHDGVLESARQYLAWEKGLIARMDEQEKSVFVRGPAPDITQEAASGEAAQTLQKAR